MLELIIPLCLSSAAAIVAITNSIITKRKEKILMEKLERWEKSDPTISHNLKRIYPSVDWNQIQKTTDQAIQFHKAIRHEESEPIHKKSMIAKWTDVLDILDIMKEPEQPSQRQPPIHLIHFADERIVIPEIPGKLSLRKKTPKEFLSLRKRPKSVPEQKITPKILNPISEKSVFPQLQQKTENIPGNLDHNKPVRRIFTVNTEDYNKKDVEKKLNAITKAFKETEKIKHNIPKHLEQIIAKHKSETLNMHDLEQIMQIEINNVTEEINKLKKFGLNDDYLNEKLTTLKKQIYDTFTKASQTTLNQYNTQYTKEDFFIPTRQPKNITINHDINQGIFAIEDNHKDEIYNPIETLFHDALNDEPLFPLDKKPKIKVSQKKQPTTGTVQLNLNTGFLEIWDGNKWIKTYKKENDPAENVNDKEDKKFLDKELKKFLDKELKNIPEPKPLTAIGCKPKSSRIR